jgi:hypothetical protein
MLQNKANAKTLTKESQINQNSNNKLQKLLNRPEKRENPRRET